MQCALTVIQTNANTVDRFIVINAKCQKCAMAVIAVKPVLVVEDLNYPVKNVI